MFICVNSLIFSVANLQTKYEKNLFYIQVMINKKQKEIIRRFAGKIDETKIYSIIYDSETAIFFDFNKESILG